MLRWRSRGGGAASRRPWHPGAEDKAVALDVWWSREVAWTRRRRASRQKFLHHPLIPFRCCPTDGKYFALISIQSCWTSSPIFGVAHTKHVIASLNMYFCLRFIFRNAHLHAINLPKMTKLLPLQVAAYNFIQFALLVSMMTKLLPFLS